MELGAEARRTLRVTPLHSLDAFDGKNPPHSEQRAMRPKTPRVSRCERKALGDWC